MALPDYHDPAKPVVLLDVDGVLANFVDGALACVYEITGVRHHHDDVTGDSIEDTFNLSDDQRAMLRAMLSVPGFCRDLLPYAEAFDGVRQLQTIANVYPVTAPFKSTTWVREREGWLHTYFGIDRKMITHTEAKHLVTGDVFVDDKPALVRAWRHTHPTGIGVLWRRPYNDAEVGFVPHTNRWDDVVALVETIRTLRG